MIQSFSRVNMNRRLSRRQDMIVREKGHPKMPFFDAVNDLIKLKISSGLPLHRLADAIPCPA